MGQIQPTVQELKVGKETTRGPHSLKWQPSSPLWKEWLSADVEQGRVGRGVQTVAPPRVISGERALNSDHSGDPLSTQVSRAKQDIGPGQQ